VGAVLGVFAGLGVLLAATALADRPRRRLDDRLVPYLPGVVRARREAIGGLPGWLVRSGPGWCPGRPRDRDRDLTALRRRLDQAGTGVTVADFRVRQVLWGVAGALLGAGADLAGLLRGHLDPVTGVGLAVVGAVAGTLGCDRALTVRVRRRADRIAAEFPVVAELLALAVGAGEGTVEALERVGRVCHGELATDLRQVLAEVRAGAAPATALTALAARTPDPGIGRFVDGVVVALERGTPLADVLRAQAQDARDRSLRHLMEVGGRREVAMMIPVVFLILPVTVAFAVYPGLAVLELG
jgi:tight adherence protein C